MLRVLGLKQMSFTVSSWPYIVLMTAPMPGSQMHICNVTNYVQMYI